MPIGLSFFWGEEAGGSGDINMLYSKKILIGFENYKVLMLEEEILLNESKYPIGKGCSH